VLPFFLTFLAPAPLPREKPVTQLTPGAYTAHWGGRPFPVQLGKDGSWHCRWDGVEWSGAWEWRAGERMLHVKESPATGPEDWFSWEATLDAKLQGEALILSSGPPETWSYQPVEFQRK
jgi:hypothetical protein